MQIFRKMVCFISIFSILLISAQNVLAQEEVENQQEAYEAYLCMSETLDFRMDVPSQVYPEYFGGCYLEGENLVIQITKDNDEIRQFYYDACNNSNKVEFEVVSHEYGELLSLEETVVPVIAENTRVYESYVDVKNNTFNVGVDSKMRRMTMDSVLEELPVEIYQMEEPPILTSMRGGEKISGDVKDGSICFFGTYNGKTAMVTHGHDNAVGTNIKYNGTTVGSVVHQNYKLVQDADGYYVSYGDFSIVDISNSIVDESNTVKTASGTISATGTANLVVGLNVDMYGYASTRISGTVKNTSVTMQYSEDITYAPVRVKGLVTIQNTSGTTVAQGDSGGPVIYQTTAGVNRVAGCITGYRGGLYSYITPSALIENAGFDFN